MSTNLTEVEKAILIDASEDYTPLSEASFEALSRGAESAREAVIHLLNLGYIYVSELEAPGVREVRQLGLDEALDVVGNPDNWKLPPFTDERYHAISATKRGMEMVKEILRSPDAPS
ncbi:MAG TPA: hypothetical protein VMT90_06280 [Dehalococcoidia bacterium]|jgi:hypothetical protein|nr:hypothetical protein [Dehalococcoidia bacterium]